jgi:predicted Zn-dependent peptidase
VSGLRVDHAVLDDGLRVVGEHNPAAASTAVGVVVETGSRDERPEEHGVSHFLEHLCFKGDDERTGSDVSRAFDALGARYNAYTSEERTVYYGAVLPEAAPALLELLDGMLRPALRAEDIEVERQVVLEEIAMYADRPDAVAFERGARAYFDANAFGRGVLGTEDSVRGLDAERVRGYWDRRYGADNQLVVITGRYDWDATLRFLERARRPATGAAGGGERLAPIARSGRGGERKAGVHRAHAALFAPGVGRGDPRRMAASLLAQTIGDDDNGALFWALVEPGIADSAVLWHDPADGFGSFQAYLGCDAADVGTVLERVDAELERVQREGVSEGAWRPAQRTLATGLTLRGETPMGRLVAVASSYLDRGRVQGVQEVVDEVLRTERSAGEALLAERPFDARYTFVLEPGAATAG